MSSFRLNPATLINLVLLLLFVIIQTCKLPLNQFSVVPGKSSYKDATHRNKFHEKDISIFSDSIPKGIRWREINSYVKFGIERPFGFPGANSKQLSRYINLNENSNSDTVIIKVVINVLWNGSNELQNDDLIQNVGSIIEKCRFCGKKFIFISGLVPYKYTTCIPR